VIYLLKIYLLLFIQAELLTKQLSEVHDEAETVTRLRSELAKAEERLHVLTNASDFNAEATSLMDAMQGVPSPHFHFFSFLHYGDVSFYLFIFIN
jgi:hypothetical protein